MAKKKSLASILLQKSESDLLQLLNESYDRIRQLEEQNRKLQAQVQKYKTQARRERQRSSSLRGQLRAEQAKVESIKTSIKVARGKTKAAEKRAEAAEAQVRTVKNILKEIKPTLTKEQVFEMYRSSNLDRFWDRLTQVHQFDPAKLQEMRAKMASWTSQKLRDIIRIAGWRSTWYDSDAEWNASELAGWDERNTYAFIMSY